MNCTQSAVNRRSKFAIEQKRHLRAILESERVTKQSHLLYSFQWFIGFAFDSGVASFLGRILIMELYRLLSVCGEVRRLRSAGIQF